MKEVTRVVRQEELGDLLDDPPRATLAFVRDGAIEALPVAFRFSDGRYLFAISLGWGPLPAAAKLLIDDGPWYFDLRGTWVRGSVTPSEPVPGADPELRWYELIPVKSVAWHYGSMRAR